MRQIEIGPETRKLMRQQFGETKIKNINKIKQMINIGSLADLK